MNLKQLPKNANFLLAMSGGVDSCVLFYLLLNENFNFSVAHANFKLRGRNSDNDAEFVSELCTKNKIQFFIKAFDVKSYKQNHKLSTQIAARELRYDWFEDLMNNHNIDYVLTAHHLNDSIETFVINATRGSGLNGLTGIQNQSKIIRPLLNYKKEEIISFAKENNLEWREDASNAKDDYIRNAIRHRVIPELDKITPNIYASFAKTLENLKKEATLLQDYIQIIKEEVSERKDNIIYFNINKLRNYQNAIFHLFNEYGFNYPLEIKKLLDAENSAEIQSEKFRLIKDRDYLVLSEKSFKSNTFIINDLNASHLPIKINWYISEKNTEFDKIKFDYDKLKFPLSLRNYQTGDVFYPAGMNGKSKKISKFYKDLKLSKIEKENTWLLCDAYQEIIWIVGYRQDIRFLPTNNTKKWLIVKN